LRRDLKTPGGLALVGVAKKGCNPALKNIFADCVSYSGIPNLFSDVMTDVLDSTLDIQTWCGGPWPQPSQACLPSYCPRSGHKVYNTRNVTPAADVHWSTANDHSKWIITAAGSRNPWVCFGDINYSDVQRKRGGGFLCFQDADLHSAFESFVGTTDPCGHEDDERVSGISSNALASKLHSD
jgi:hypothetical protein